MDKQIVTAAKQLYNLQLTEEITTGHSGDRIFAGKRAGKEYILRVAVFSEERNAKLIFVSGPSI